MGIKIITSRDNHSLKFARNVRNSKELGLIFIEGVRIAEEALRSGLVLRSCFVSDEFRDSDPGRALLRKLDGERIETFAVSDRLFGSIADTENPQGIAFIADRPALSRLQIEENVNDGDRAMPIVVYLQSINNPSNLGAILRTAEAAGVAGVVVSKNSANVFSAKAIRASMGSIFRIPIWADASLEDVCGWAKEHGLMLSAADIGPGNEYSNVDWRRARLLVFGSEAHGLSKNDSRIMDEIIRVPMANGVESLNLAVTCGILLFEAKRQVSESN
ncbi:MAG: RNA methyltransferase [Pyrinomonadaceae bacterium]